MQQGSRHFLCGANVAQIGSFQNGTSRDDTRTTLVDRQTELGQLEVESERQNEPELSPQSKYRRHKQRPQFEREEQNEGRRKTWETKAGAQQGHLHLGVVDQLKVFQSLAKAADAAEDVLMREVVRADGRAKKVKPGESSN